MNLENVRKAFYKVEQEVEMESIDVEHDFWVYAPTYVRR